MPRTILFACLFAALAVSAVADPGVRIVRLSMMEGPVQLYMADGNGWRPALRDMPLVEGERVRTGERGRAEIELENGSTVRLAADSEIRLDELGRSPSGIALTTLMLTSGSAYVTLDKADSPAFLLQFPGGQASGAARNVAFRVDVGADGAGEVAVLDGNADVGYGASLLRLAKRDDVALSPTRAPEFTETASAEDYWDRWTAGQPAGTWAQPAYTNASLQYANSQNGCSWSTFTGANAWCWSPTSGWTSATTGGPFSLFMLTPAQMTALQISFIASHPEIVYDVANNCPMLLGSTYGFLPGNFVQPYTDCTGPSPVWAGMYDIADANMGGGALGGFGPSGVVTAPAMPVPLAPSGVGVPAPAPPSRYNPPAPAPRGFGSTAVAASSAAAQTTSRSDARSQISSSSKASQSNSGTSSASSRSQTGSSDSSWRQSSSNQPGNQGESSSRAGSSSNFGGGGFGNSSAGGGMGSSSRASAPAAAPVSAGAAAPATAAAAHTGH